MENKMYQLFEDMKTVIEETQTDVNKFAEKGNKAAGTRTRKAMQSIKALAQGIRVEVSAQNKA